MCDCALKISQQHLRQPNSLRLIDPPLHRLYRMPSEAARQSIRAAKWKPVAAQPASGQHILWQTGAVDRESKERLLKQRGCVIW